MLDSKIKEYFSPNSTALSMFHQFCGDKAFESDYIDLSSLLLLNKLKEEIITELAWVGSSLVDMYKKPYPTIDNLSFVSYELLNPPSHVEYEAILHYFFHAVKKQEDRRELILYLLSLHPGWREIDEKAGIFYNKRNVELHIVGSITEITGILPSRNNTRPVFFRGHSSANYMLRPSLFRNTIQWDQSYEMFNEMLINCPEDFKDCGTCFEKLVKMQHYGLPTRLLDITSNPLVAVYFACIDRPDEYGELVILKATDICYPDDTNISAMSNLSALDSRSQTQLEASIVRGDTEAVFNQESNAYQTLRSMIKREKPGIESFSPKDVMLDAFVYASKKNERIRRQEGAFIICGLQNGLRLEKMRFTIDGKKIIVIIKNKREIIKTLDMYSINRASLFPEIDTVAEYLKQKYSHY